ncbi:MAG: DNA-directed RNA polymerase specialized sigma24 family protein [Candidatus Latescibacterota bacterium]|jgi:DNA-directed RNA polymerase specialized sigma24 family protein
MAKMNLSKDQFFSLIQASRKTIYKICHSYCRTPEDKQDIEQEIILQRWKSAERYDVQHKVSTPRYCIALNIGISFFRSSRL